MNCISHNNKCRSAGNLGYFQLIQMTRIMLGKKKKSPLNNSYSYLHQLLQTRTPIKQKKQELLFTTAASESTKTPTVGKTTVSRGLIERLIEFDVENSREDDLKNSKEQRRTIRLDSKTCCPHERKGLFIFVEKKAYVPMVTSALPTVPKPDQRRKGIPKNKKSNGSDKMMA